MQVTLYTKFFQLSNNIHKENLLPHLFLPSKATGKCSQYPINLVKIHVNNENYSVSSFLAFVQLFLFSCHFQINCSYMISGMPGE